MWFLHLDLGHGPRRDRDPVHELFQGQAHSHGRGPAKGLGRVPFRMEPLMALDSLPRHRV